MKAETRKYWKLSICDVFLLCTSFLSLMSDRAILNCSSDYSGAHSIALAFDAVALLPQFLIFFEKQWKFSIHFILFCSILLYSSPFYSVLPYSILLCSALSCSTVFYSILFCYVVLCSILFCSILTCSILLFSISF